MNENLNLVEILKDCPKGTKLYSSALGEVAFVAINNYDRTYPIIVKTEDGTFCFTKQGELYDVKQSECLLFPSREQRDWSKFDAPWLKKESDDDIIKTAILSHLKKMWGNCQDDVCGVHIEDAINWLEKQGEDKKEINNFDVRPGLYKCVHRMFDGTPDGRLLFEIDNVYKCISKHDRAEFEVSYGHSVYLEDPVVCKYFIPFEDKGEPKFKVGDWVVYDNNSVYQVKEIEYITDAIPRYELKNIDGDKLSIPSTLNYILRNWTIEDAKDGDVLVCDINKAEIGGDVEKLPNIVSTIFIFRKLINSRGYIHSYCHLYDKHFLGLQRTMYYNSFVYNIRPATEEQCDTLIKAINDDGYEWDAEEKELKRIK